MPVELTAVRGMLFEEAILFLLRHAGYRPVTTIGNDPTLRSHAAGMGISVVGRGAYHQIDAIADYFVAQPFSHPQRLLVEAKCYTNKKAVDLDTTRSAVGVLKDVCEYWNTVDGIPTDHRRYHYQKAIFSATTFSAPAERYAFAHDIYLFPMARSSCFAGLLSAIFGVKAQSVRRGWWTQRDRPLRELRLAVRTYLEEESALGQPMFGGEYGGEWVRFGQEVGRLGGVVVAMVGRSFPLFLVPSNREALDNANGEIDVRIRWASTKGWTITDTRNRVLFSFDLPPVLFYMYARSQTLTRVQAAVMKSEMFADLQAVTFADGIPRIVRFVPEAEWFQRLRQYAEANAEMVAME